MSEDSIFIVNVCSTNYSISDEKYSPKPVYIVNYTCKFWRGEKKANAALTLD